MKRNDAEKVFRGMMREISYLTTIEEEMMWDSRVNLPPQGSRLPQRADGIPFREKI